MIRLIQFFFFLALLSIQLTVKAQKSPVKTRLLFIYDASNSMNGKWQTGNKHQVAKRFLFKALDSLKYVDNIELALRVYGHQSNYRNGQNCKDTKLEVPFKKDNIELIKSKMNDIRPKGTTLIARSLEYSENDFPSCSNCRNVIILITDGGEECDGDPCAISKMLQRRGIILKPFIIGLGLDGSFKETFSCVGNYFDAFNEEVFNDILGVVITQALNATTAQVNLLNTAGRPTETNVAFTLLDHETGDQVYNYVHTLNGAGNPDTVFFEPSNTYDLVVHTLPKVTKQHVSITPGIHNIIGVKAPQGELIVTTGHQVRSEQPQVIVRQKGKMQTLNVQKTGTKHKYLVGKYDLEVLTLPRTYIRGAEVKQSHTTTVEIPRSGLLTLMPKTPGFGSVFKLTDDNKLEWVFDLNSNSSRQSIRLQPGDYRVIFRTKAASDTKFSRVKDFKIISGSSVAVKL